MEQKNKKNMKSENIALNCSRTIVFFVQNITHNHTSLMSSAGRYISSMSRW